MKLRIERSTLVDQLTLASRGVNLRGGGLFVLTGLHLRADGDGLTATGTDLDLTVRTRLSTPVEAEGETVVPARLLTDIVRALPSGEVTLELTDDDVQISSARAQFSIRTLPTADFPVLPQPAGDSVTVPAGDLAEAFRQVVRAASSDDARPILTGVLMTARGDGLRLVATDSYRLALRDLPEAQVLGPGQQVLVPSRALEELGRILNADRDVTMRLGEREVTFEVGDEHRFTQIICRLIAGDFPSYQPLIPESYDNRLVIDRAALLDGARRLRLLARDTNAPLRMDLREDGIELTVISQDVGSASEEVDATYSGESTTVAFNPDYLIEGLEAVGGNTIELVRLDALKPAVLQAPGQGEFLYLLMPVRVS
ncbi:DNA polymerase III subunit beta [Candidatus Poriferisodalis sp.]|uniref:DNA polymerase III subunit beta n=1 Tax=Candidatus Poriferisodalis sp. TaxID=3101277 RepID=UPI003B016D2D